jgi:hypothetical protein
VPGLGQLTAPAPAGSGFHTDDHSHDTAQVIVRTMVATAIADGTHQRLVLLPIRECLVRYSAERREPAELNCPRGNASSRGRSQKQCGDTSCCRHCGRRVLLREIFRLGNCVANSRALQPLLRPRGIPARAEPALCAAAVACCAVCPPRIVSSSDFASNMSGLPQQ